MATRVALPQLVYQRLAVEGPTYGAALGEDLGCSSGAISGALASLRRRGLVAVAGREPSPRGSRPRIFYAVTAPPPDDWAARGPGHCREGGDGDPDPLRRQLEELRLEVRGDYGVAAEIVDLVFMNGPVPGI